MDELLDYSHLVDDPVHDSDPGFLLQSGSGNYWIKCLDGWPKRGVNDKQLLDKPTLYSPCGSTVLGAHWRSPIASSKLFVNVTANTFRLNGFIWHVVLVLVKRRKSVYWKMRVL